MCSQKNMVSRNKGTAYIEVYLVTILGGISVGN